MLANILGEDALLDVYHQPSPSLLYVSRAAYAGGKIDSNALDAAVMAARYELVRNSFITGGSFIETNNRITFFAPALARIFREAKFIHLVRHPGAFVRSALMRGYYKGTITDEGRITPRESDDAHSRWERMTDIQRCAWLWNQTNVEIENFKRQVSVERVMTIRAEDMFRNPGESARILSFLGGRVSGEREIAKRLRKRVNAQRGGQEDVPPWEQWPESWRDELKSEARLAESYGYELG